MKVTNSLQWSEVEAELNKQVRSTPPKFAIDAQKMFNNLRAMITKLSKLEMEARTSSSGSKRRVNEQLELINIEIESFEQWLMMLLLMK